MVIQKYFIENEYLPKIVKNYNYRSYQAEFSEKIYDLLSSYKTVVAEAPTGYGKTFSYLIPIFELGRRTIISTKTKQLMNQILVKDIPNLKKILKGNDLKIASLLGRRNYFCHYRFGKFIVPYRDMYIDVVSWVDNINEDDIILVPNDKFDGEVIGKITADSYQCIGGKCSYINRCSFYNAKDIANNSDIVVTNHHMLLADIAMRIKYDGSYNFDFAEHIVFDEAHSIVDIFPAYLGDELSSYSILNFIKDNRSYLGEDRFKDLYSKWKVLISRHKNTDRLTEKIESDFKKLFDEMDKIFSSYITEEDYSIFQKYRDTFENIYKNDGVKVVENNGDFLSIKNIPISSGDKFVEGLKCSCISSLMISATISFNGSFDYFMGELGLDDTVEKIRLEPPENFMKQGKLFINDYFIDNVEDKKIFYADLMKHLKGATLVIFNNLSHMLEIYRYLSDLFKDKKFYLQSDDLQKIDINENTVIMGCSILREGIDFAGKGVKYVIIDKLPFENISDVYVKAKLEYYEKHFGNSFYYYYLPRAVIFFKQAVGRLIRNENESGYWIILDGRISKKSYGQYFLNVLKDAEIVDEIIN